MATHHQRCKEWRVTHKNGSFRWGIDAYTRRSVLLLNQEDRSRVPSARVPKFMVNKYSFRNCHGTYL